MGIKIQLSITNISKSEISLKWGEKCKAEENRFLCGDEDSEAVLSAEGRSREEEGASWKDELYWADRCAPTTKFRKIYEGRAEQFTFSRSTHIPHYFKVCRVSRENRSWSEICTAPVVYQQAEQLEALNRGLVAFRTSEGVLLSWRLWKEEVTGYTKTGMAGVNFNVYRNGEWIARVMDSTNYLDRDKKDSKTSEVYYQVEPVNRRGEAAGEKCAPVQIFASGQNYYDIPIRQPEGGVTPSGEQYQYHANDMSVGDVDGDGEYEYIVKWDPENSKDVSQRGYTGHCILDCYRMDGTLLWRLDLGPNIRAGAHYTQFMVYDFDGDGKAEISVKTAPGSKMYRYQAALEYYKAERKVLSTIPVRAGSRLGKAKREKHGYKQDNERSVMQQSGRTQSSDANKTGSQPCEEYFVTLTESALAQGASHTDNYVCSRESYLEHLVEVFEHWHEHPQVLDGIWPATLEECFGIPVSHSYPLEKEAAKELADYFVRVYAPSRSEKNELWDFEGFIYEGPEFLTMFSGMGEELETIDFPFERQDDGLLWGDYAMPRIEPCNRVDRFLSGVAYLDGEHPSLIICRGYYTRACIAAYDFREGRHRQRFLVDSGHVPMSNPFCDHPHAGTGTDEVFGVLAGQGNHSLATADIDGDGCQEIIYGAAVIDHDGSVSYSSYGMLPDGRRAKFGHGDAIHVADIDPDRPGYEIFHVFEGAEEAPYGFALCDAQTGEVLWGERAERDLGRCMIGDIALDVRGLQCFVDRVFDCEGRELGLPVPGTNQPVHFAADLSTQLLDGADYVHGKHCGVVQDNTHGIMLIPDGVCVNNGTKGNACLVADILGDYREEILYRKADDSGIRIYFAAEISRHKLFTLMHDVMYRTGVAWQNNCYNQPGYTKFYLASDMEWEYVLPGMPFQPGEPER